MGRTLMISSRMRMMLGGLATVAATAILASPAGAVRPASGEATIRPASHSSGRTLSGQGVEIFAGAGAHATAGMLALPIAFLEAGGAGPWAQTPATVTFKHGKRSLALTEIRFEFAAGILVGTLGGMRLAVLRLGGAVDIYAADGSVALSGGRLRLTKAAADLLRAKLGLERALADRGVGQISLAASEAPQGSNPDEEPPPPSELYPIYHPPPPPPPSRDLFLDRPAMAAGR